MKNYFIGIVPSFKYTILYLASEEKILHYYYLCNDKIESQIADGLSHIKNEKKIEAIALFLGPSPLTTTRGICAWCKGWHIASKIPIVTIKGEKYYFRNDGTVLLPHFKNTFSLIEKIDESYSQISEDEIIAYFQNKKLKNLFFTYYSQIPYLLSDKFSVATALFPNISMIVKEARKKIIIKEYSSLESLFPYNKPIFIDKK